VTLRWTPTALHDLESLAEYIAEDAPAAAASMVEMILFRRQPAPLHGALSGLIIQVTGDDHQFMPVFPQVLRQFKMTRMTGFLR